MVRKAKLSKRKRGNHKCQRGNSQMDGWAELEEKGVIVKKEKENMMMLSCEAKAKEKSVHEMLR